MHAGWDIVTVISINEKNLLLQICDGETNNINTKKGFGHIY